MKKAFIYFVAASVVLASCKKDKTVFSESADDRINTVLTAYSDALVNAPYGWKGFVFPGALNGGAVAFYFKFNNANRVDMFSDFDSLSNVTVKQSSYRLKALQQPALIFDTYSYITVLADPDAAANGGYYGSGLVSDFEFAIDSIKGDTVKLTGRLHSTKAYLVKASKQEMDLFYNKKHNNRLFENLNKYLKYFKRFTAGGVTYEIILNTLNRTAFITWIDGSGNAHTIVTAYYYTTTGVGFITPVVNGSTTISGLDNITWNPSTLSMTWTVNGAGTTVLGNKDPLATDVSAPVRWWQGASGTQGGYWISVNGFHINGVDDAYGIKNIPNFYYLGYVPNIFNGGYDGLAFFKVLNNALTWQYIPAYSPMKTNPAGISTLQYLGNYYHDPSITKVPTSHSIPVYRTVLQFTDPMGYRFVQLDDRLFDMVNVRDGQVWIRWQY